MEEQLLNILDSFDFKLERLKPSEFAEKYRVMTSEVSPFPGKFSYDLTPYLREVIDTMDPSSEARVISVMKGAQLGFALDIKTPIKTPSGWSTIENLEIGNVVYSDDGKKCNVTNVTDVMHGHKCYEVHFSDGSIIVADENHLWTVGDREKHCKTTINTKKISKEVNYSYGKRFFVSNFKNGVPPLRRDITNVIEVESVPVKCISVDAKSKLFLAGKSFIPTHNSTGVIEPGVGWIIKENPGSILFFVGHADLVPKAMAKIDQMIDSCGIRDLIRPNSMRKKTQKTGDTNTNKEFPGGSLLLGSPGNHKAIRQISVRYGFIDDYESVKGSTKESGSTKLMIQQRFAAYQDKMKLYYISTPEVQQTSNIEPAFLMGDQRYFMVPCPLCEEKIKFEWEIKDEAGKVYGGITWKLDEKNRLIEDSVGYICPKCKGFFTDKHKHKMNLAGEWVPTATPQQRGYLSYHINSLYAPPGMYDWAHYVEDWLAANPKDADPKETELQTFYNVVLGQTYKVKGKSPKASQLATNSGRYEIGIIPNELSIKDGNGEIFMLTLGSDLNGIVEDARLDYEIIAWSTNGTTYAIDHGSIGTFIPRERTRKHKVDRERWTYDHNNTNSVWPEFEDVLNSRFKTDDGREMGISVAGVDTGHYTAQAYDFIDNFNDILIFGLKGKDIDKFRRFGVDTPVTKKARERDNLYLVEVNQIKDELAELIELNWTEDLGVDQPAGFCNFPAPNGRTFSMPHYFNHFEAEHRVIDKNPKGEDVGARWVKKKSSAQNHLFDCRIYNIALANILAVLVCKEAGVKEISWSVFVDLMQGNG